MGKDLFIRGLDNEIHKKLSSKAEKKGVSLNSLLKDVVDKWAEQDEEDAPRHELILYSDERDLLNFLKSVDYSSKERSIARVCCGSKDNPGVRFLNKQGWLDGTIEPYRGFYEKPDQYVEKVLKKVSGKLDKKTLFGLMFLAGDLSRKKSLSDAAKFCHWYDEKNVPGSTYCMMNIKDIPSGNAEELLDFFNFHDQVFIIRKKGFFKIHLSEESIHKLFLS